MSVRYLAATLYAVALSWSGIAAAQESYLPDPSESFVIEELDEDRAVPREVPRQEPAREPAYEQPREPEIAEAAPEVCREYEQTIVVRGQPREAYGRACRNPDGSWRLVTAPTVVPENFEPDTFEPETFETEPAPVYQAERPRTRIYADGPDYRNYRGTLAPPSTVPATGRSYRAYPEYRRVPPGWMKNGKGPKRYYGFD